MSNRASLFNPAVVHSDSEELLGRWFERSGHRKDIFLATKFANKYNPSGGARTLDSSPEYCKAACESSLKKLGTDYIDLFYWCVGGSRAWVATWWDSSSSRREQLEQPPSRRKNPDREDGSGHARAQEVGHSSPLPIARCNSILTTV
jgi:hypothetical protein